MMKLLALPVILLVGLAIACGGGSNTTSVTIHGHNTEIGYEVEVLTEQVDDFFNETGIFKCDDVMCHIEAEEHHEE